MTREEAFDSTAPEEIELRLLLDAIYLKYHYDFRAYSRTSLRRRLTAALPALQCATLSELQGKLLRDEETFVSLIEFLTVRASDLFREPESFWVLRREIVPLLRTYPSLRIWIAGCSTGEEAYSMAILLAEEGLLERSLIYATDINQASLRAAESGIYSADRLETFTENHRRSGAPLPLALHYTEAYGSAVFSRQLREKIIFSDHSLATDGVFAEMQIVSCRNVLIYFQRPLQNRALRLISDSLCRRGFLCLARPETLRFTECAPEFSELHQRWYQKC